MNKWSGRVIVNQLQPEHTKTWMIGDWVQNCIDYYNKHNQWQRCGFVYKDGTAVFYEILKSGTMRIDVDARAGKEQNQ